MKKSISKYRKLITAVFSLVFILFVFTGCSTDKSFTVKFNSNGGSGTMKNINVSSFKDIYENLPDCTFTNNGLESNVWRLNSADGKYVYKYGDISSEVQDGDIVTIYADWSTVGFKYENSYINGNWGQKVMTDYSGDITTVYMPAYYKSQTGAVTKLTSYPANLFQNHTEIEYIKKFYFSHIASNFFDGCINLKEFDLTGIETIGNYAFKDCISIEEIIIPESVTKIYAGAFEGWTESQTIRVLGGRTAEDLNANINSDWTAGTNATIIFE